MYKLNEGKYKETVLYLIIEFENILTEPIYKINIVPLLNVAFLIAVFRNVDSNFKNYR